MNNNLFINIMTGNMYRVVGYKDITERKNNTPSIIYMEWVSKKDIMKIPYTRDFKMLEIYLQIYKSDVWQNVSWRDVFYE